MTRRGLLFLGVNGSRQKGQGLMGGGRYGSVLENPLAKAICLSARIPPYASTYPFPKSVVFRHRYLGSDQQTS